jgi:hypothetical protein
LRGGGVPSLLDFRAMRQQAPTERRATMALKIANPGMIGAFSGVTIGAVLGYLDASRHTGQTPMAFAGVMIGYGLIMAIISGGFIAALCVAWNILTTKKRA